MVKAGWVISVGGALLVESELHSQTEGLVSVVDMHYVLTSNILLSNYSYLLDASIVGYM